MGPGEWKTVHTTCWDGKTHLRGASVKAVLGHCLLVRPSACLKHPSLGSFSGQGLRSWQSHQDHVTPAAAKPLGNAKSLLASNKLGDIHFLALSSPTCSLIRKCLSGSCHSNSSRRACCMPSPSGWLRSALKRPRVERWILLFLASAKVSLGTQLGVGKEQDPGRGWQGSRLKLE